MGELLLIYLWIGCAVSFGLFLLMLYVAIRHDEVRVTSFNKRIHKVIEFVATMLVVIPLWPLALLTLRVCVETDKPNNGGDGQ